MLVPGCAALAACRGGDTLVATMLDRLARSVPDARAIADELTAAAVKLNIDGSVDALAMIAEVEADLVRMRTREGIKVAKAKGRFRGKQPKLSPHKDALRRGGTAPTGGPDRES